MMGIETEYEGIVDRFSLLHFHSSWQSVIYSLSLDIEYMPILLNE